VWKESDSSLIVMRSHILHLRNPVLFLLGTGRHDNKGTTGALEHESDSSFRIPGHLLNTGFGATVSVLHIHV
jgi:hypothetical protein